MIRNNDDEIAELRARLAQLGSADDTPPVRPVRKETTFTAATQQEARDEWVDWQRQPPAHLEDGTPVAEPEPGDCTWCGRNDNEAVIVDDNGDVFPYCHRHEAEVRSIYWHKGTMMRQRFDHIDHLPYLRHVLDTAEQFARAVPNPPSSDPLVQEMIRNNDDEIAGLSTPRPARQRRLAVARRSVRLSS